MEDCAEAMQSETNLDDKDMVCKPCRDQDLLGFGQELCEQHGNEFTDWKCGFCCSIALFFCCGGQYKFCTPCHNNAMNGQLEPQSKCTGGKDCPLGLAYHPLASREREANFPLGCSLCRSEKLAQIADNENATGGINLESRQDMKEKFDHVQGHGLEHEMQVIRKDQEPVYEIDEETGEPKLDEEGNPIIVEYRDKEAANPEEEDKQEEQAEEEHEKAEAAEVEEAEVEEEKEEKAG